MKHFYFLTIIFLSLSISAQNLLSNGSFDDQSGWTFVNQYGTDSTIDINNTPDDTTDDVEAHIASITIENGDRKSVV